MPPGARVGVAAVVVVGAPSDAAIGTGVGWLGRGFGCCALGSRWLGGGWLGGAGLPVPMAGGWEFGHLWLTGARPAILLRSCMRPAGGCEGWDEGWDEGRGMEVAVMAGVRLGGGSLFHVRSGEGGGWLGRLWLWAALTA